MTVTTSTNKKTYTGDASTVAFAYNFKILATTDLQVYLRLIASPYTETLQTETTHYSVSGAGDAGGGTVTMVTAPPVTDQLVILRVVPQTQLTDYTANDAFPAETHEEALDRLAMIVQDQQETLNRALKASTTLSDLTTPEFLEPAAARASKFLAFDSDGDELTVTDGPIADAVITSPADAHVLLYDNSDSRWENKAVSGDIAITAAGVASIATGVILNADVNASAAIVDTKLATISTADKVSGAAIQVDGAADGTSITIADSDKLIIDDAGSTKYINASQINSYVSASVAADDIATGDAAASFETSSGAVVVDSQASTTTIDGHTGVTVQSSSSGDILLDSAADVVLDAAGNDVIFKASGTAIGTLTNSSSDLVIAASVEDKDILLKGDDGGSAITALQLDMSDAGKATFSGAVALGDDQKLSFGAAPDLTIEYDEDGTDTTRIVAANGLSLAPHGTSSGNTTELRFMELAAGGDNYVGFKAPDACSDSVYTLPAAFPASNKTLQSTDAGVLTWESAGSGASLSGSTNNTVTTVTGSDAIQGEANLTFDGTSLTVTGNAGIGGTRTDGTLHVQSASAGTIAANANADELVLEGSADVGLSILAGNAHVIRLNFGDDGDNDAGIIEYRTGPNDTMRLTVQGTERVHLNNTGTMSLGDTTNANMTVGTLINQAGSDDEAFALKSSDIAHGFTSGYLATETDTYFSIRKNAAAVGGIDINILSEDVGGTEVVARFLCFGGTAAVSDATSSNATITFLGGEHDGSNALIDAPTNANLFAIRNAGASGTLTRLLLKADDGELHLGNSTLVALDADDDAQAVRALQKSNSKGDGIVNSAFDLPIYSYDKLRELEVVGEKDENGEYLIRLQPYLNLHDGAIFQEYVRTNIMAKLLDDMLPGFGAEFSERLNEAKMPYLPALKENSLIAS